MGCVKALYLSLVVFVTVCLISFNFPSTRTPWKKLLESYSLNIRPFIVTMLSSSRTTVSDTSHTIGQRNITSDIGYVLATHYSDQLTGSASNVLSLQCWASTLLGNVRVVEPFLHYGSVMGFSLSPYNNMVKKSAGYTGPKHAGINENRIKISDLFDMVPWRNAVSTHHFAPLISWKYFVDHAPRQLILVDQVCGGGKCMSCEGKNLFESNVFLSLAVQFAEVYKFDLVRKVCYEMKMYSEKEFQELVYGAYNPQDSVAIFNHFGGLQKYGSKYRIRVDSDRCSKGRVPLALKASSRVLKDSIAYINRYMPQTKHGGYVCIMMRLERIALANKFSRINRKQQNNIVNKCINKIVKEVNKLKKENKISELFISTDIGKYGSLGLRTGSIDNHYELLMNGVDRLYKELLGTSVDREEIMSRIEAVIAIQNPGYVAQLEKTLAANATCLVLVGGGTFQRSVKDLYYTQFNEARAYNTVCGVKQMRC